MVTRHLCSWHGVGLRKHGGAQRSGAALDLDGWPRDAPGCTCRGPCRPPNISVRTLVATPRPPFRGSPLSGAGLRSGLAKQEQGGNVSVHPCVTGGRLLRPANRSQVECPGGREDLSVSYHIASLKWVQRSFVLRLLCNRRCRDRMTPPNATLRIACPCSYCSDTTKTRSYFSKSMYECSLGRSVWKEADRILLSCSSRPWRTTKQRPRPLLRPAPQRSRQLLARRQP